MIASATTWMTRRISPSRPREQQVLTVDLGVPEAQRLGLRLVQRFL
jgi:hypothetical protein